MDSHKIQGAIAEKERGVVGTECELPGQYVDPVRLDPRKHDHESVHEDGHHSSSDGH